MIIEYEDKYLEDVRDLLVELEEYIVSIDEDNLDIVSADYREKMALVDLDKIKNFGFHYGTIAGITVGIEDLEIPFLENAENTEGLIIDLRYNGGGQEYPARTFITQYLSKPGNHLMGINFTRDIGMSINKDEIIEFDCDNSIRGWRIFLDLLYITFLKNKYLWIKIKDKSYS